MPPRGPRYSRAEVVVCAYAATYGLEDLGSFVRMARLLGRPAPSLRLKTQNIAAMLDAHGCARCRQINTLSGRTTGAGVRDTDWDVVKVFTDLVREEHFAVCRHYLYSQERGRQPSQHDEANTHLPEGRARQAA